MVRTTAKKRYAAEVREFYALIQSILDNESIYRGKAIAVTEDDDPWGDGKLNFDIFEMHVSDKIFLNEDVNGIVENFIMDELGEQGKRCYLFSGSYGTEKQKLLWQLVDRDLKREWHISTVKIPAYFHNFSLKL